MKRGNGEKDRISSSTHVHHQQLCEEIINSMYTSTLIVTLGSLGLYFRCPEIASRSIPNWDNAMVRAHSIARDGVLDQPINWLNFKVCV